MPLNRLICWPTGGRGGCPRWGMPPGVPRASPTPPVRVPPPAAWPPGKIEVVSGPAELPTPKLAPVVAEANPTCPLFGLAAPNGLVDWACAELPMERSEAKQREANSLHVRATTRFRGLL